MFLDAWEAALQVADIHWLCWLQHIQGSCMILHVCASAGKGSWCCPREQSWLQQRRKVNRNVTVLGVMAMVGVLN